MGTLLAIFFGLIVWTLASKAEEIKERLTQDQETLYEIDMVKNPIRTEGVFNTKAIVRQEEI